MGNQNLTRKMGITGKIGFFPGNWDCLHVGHVRALKEARSQCDYLLVGLKANNDDLPNKNQPIMSVEERAEILEALKYVDEIVVYQDEATLRRNDELGYIKRPAGKLEWNVRFMGADHEKKSRPHIKAEVVYISRDHNYSTSELRNRVYEAESRNRA